MAVYYVSAQRGNDAQNGTSPTTPFRTIGKATTVVAPGDTVYIGPGTYNERVVLSVAGTSAAPITWQFDPEARYVTGDLPGYCRVTSVDANGLWTTGNTWDFNAKTYNRLYGPVYIDGGSKAVYGNNTTDQICMDVYAHANTDGFYYTRAIRCFAIASMNGFSNSNCESCIGIAGNCAFNYGAATNCVAIGGYYGYNASATTNCLLIGSWGGISGGTATNCLQVATYYGNLWSVNGSNVAAYCSTANDKIAGTQIPAPLYNPRAFDLLIRALTPWFPGGLRDGGSASQAYATTDYYGLPRPLNGVPDPGPVELTPEVADWEQFYSVAPGIRIDRQGRQMFYIPAKANVAVTVSVWAKHLNTPGTKPQIRLRGRTIAEQTAIHTGADNTWQQLTVTATPTSDEVLYLVLEGQDSTAGAVAIFSDITVS